MQLAVLGPQHSMKIKSHDHKYHSPFPSSFPFPPKTHSTQWESNPLSLWNQSSSLYFILSFPQLHTPSLHSKSSKLTNTNQNVNINHQTYLTKVEMNGEDDKDKRQIDDGIKGSSYVWIHQVHHRSSSSVYLSRFGQNELGYQVFVDINEFTKIGQEVLHRYFMFFGP